MKSPVSFPLTAESSMGAVLTGLIALLSSFPLVAQHAPPGREVTLTGVVTDQCGETLGGVMLFVWGMEPYTETNGEGKFTLIVKEPGDSLTLVCRYVGIDPYFFGVRVQSEKEAVRIMLNLDFAEPCLIPYRRVSPRKWWRQLKGLFRR